ncbi:DMT family transporter [Defluviimonas salinarum]|uniref:DMT family transporter n=1 Tax=Defluviimonas salinarum TaxID=2992147 RepID=A0ABT3J2I9_9RHOB|nr:DMT family transporter [Defluviimonas salinarum]MCW3781893.1 DMT family transporter [Defluviimonas salinarum]
MSRHPLFGLGLAAFGALVLTPDTLFMRWSGMSGFPMVAWRRMLMGTLLLGLWLLSAGGRRRADLRAILSLSGLGVILCHGLNATLFSLGIGHAPVAVVLFGVATMPIFSAVLGRLLGDEPTRSATWIATAAVLAGIGIAVFGDGGSLRLDRAALVGAAAGLRVAALLASAFAIIRRARGLPIMPLVGFGALLAGSIGITAAPAGSLLSGEIWAIAVTGAVILPASFLALTHATRHTAAANVSLLMLLETVLGPAWVWIGAGEAMTPPMILGGAIVVASLALYILTITRGTSVPR